MNGMSNGHNGTATTNTSNPSANQSSESLLPRIHEALSIVHGAYSTNDSRREASIFLEEIKASNEAPELGLTLASEKSHEPVVRHYALSLLEHAIKHKWADYSAAQAATLRNCVLLLSQGVVAEDPLYLRNKTAQLWVEVAKRSWGADWGDMDELLVQLWEKPGSAVHKEFVLFVLETLSDEVFSSEDTIAILREGVLSKACVEIFTPAAVLAETFPNRQAGTPVRYGEEGWLSRIGGLLDQCLGSDLSDPQYQTCCVKVLAVYRSVMPWAIPRAIESATCVAHLCKSLAASSVTVQLASVEALYALYSRMQFSDEEFVALVCPMYTSSMVDLLRKLFEWSVVDPQDIDDEKYLFAKKFSEMMSNLGSFIEQKLTSLPPTCDLPNLLNLFLSIAQSPSFVVSIPILLAWTKLLRSDTIGESDIMNPLIAPLLELCSSRLIRYESMPQDSEDPSLVFLLEDIDTMPERHAFLGNYRRYSASIIELIVRQKRSEAILHILGQVDQAMRNLYVGQAPFSIEKYSKTSMPVLRVDAQFSVVEAALKGYMKWRATHGSKPEHAQRDEQERNAVETNLEAWCESLLEMNFEDPLIRKRTLQLAVALSTTALDKKVNFMLKTLEHILMSRPAERPEYPAYNDAVKELLTDGAYELQRLASKQPDHLLNVYSQLEAKVNEIISLGTLDNKRQVSYQTFLFTIIHRATKIDPAVRLQKLHEFVDPVQQLWQNPELDRAITSFGGFCDRLGLSRVLEYLVSRRVHEIEEWGHYQLDAEGQAIQRELEERLKSLPLRATKSFLACSTDKVEAGSAPHKVSCTLWREALPVILPCLLKFMGNAHAFHNPTNWTRLPTEMHSMVSRILTDRFWQAGISEGSKDDFYNRVTVTKSTMEGFASSIRGSIRAVREACYSILWCMSRLETDFYGFSSLPGPLAHALFADADCLSSHQLIALLNVVRLMVDDCPVELRDQFIPPILATCFVQMDAKCSSEWEKLAQKQIAVQEDDNLTNEMKEESILRQLTHTAVMMVGGFLDPARTNPTPPSTGKEASIYTPDAKVEYPSMRKFCLDSPTILEPLLVFLTHAIRMRDTRCCGVVLRVLRSIIPEFISTTNPFHASIREFISTDVLKACISSLNEPYYVELHKELAQLIASIITYYAPLTSRPKEIFLMLGLKEGAVDLCIDGMIERKGMQARQHRSMVLELLRDIKGVGVSEMGKITKSAGQARRERSKMQQEFMKVGGESKDAGKQSNLDDLEGVAGMFGEE